MCASCSRAERHLSVLMPLTRWGILAVILIFGALANSRAACPTCVNYQSGVAAGTISFGALSEASGIASSKLNPGVLWTHNDGSEGRLWAISTNGSRLATFDVNSVVDLEDIAVGPGPSNGVSYLYIGDIGGNEGTNVVRSQVQIIRTAEPTVDLAWASDPRSPSFSKRDRFSLIYPDGSYDAETLLVDPLTSDVWVVTKGSGAARFYRANLNAVPDNGTVTLEFVRSVSFDQASAGDISPDGTQIVLRRENAAALWLRCDGEPLNTALSRASQTIPVIGTPTEPNGEGIGFMRDGTGYVTISEGTNTVIYFFRSTCPAAPQFTLSISNQIAFVGGTVSFNAYAVGYPDPTYSWRSNGTLIAGQTGSSLVLSNLTLAAAVQYQVIASNASGRMTNSATLTVRQKPDLRITEVLSTAAASPGVPTADWWELTSFESQSVSLAGWRFNDNGGGLTDPYIIPGSLTIAPGESIIFVESLTAAQLTNWWGATNLPQGVQIVSYTGSSLSLGAGGDGIRLWDNVTANVNDTVASVDFGAATAGVTFNYDPVTQQFGGLSILGMNGVIRASAATDIGSPGRIRALAMRPTLVARRIGSQLRIEFDATAGRRYSLEARENLSSSTWTETGDVLQPATNGRIFFEREAAAPAQFFRVVVD
jgi:hypothetical protein